MRKEGIEFSDDIINVALTVIPIMLSLIAGYFIPWIKAKIGNEKLTTIVKWVTYAVKCAELIYDGEKQGEAKKQYVIEIINKMFNSKKIIITEEQISVLIEYAVRELKELEK